MRNIILIIALLVSSVAFSQKTFLGKRLAVSFGTSLNAPLNNKAIFFGSGVENGYNWSMLPPKIETNIGVAIFKGFSLNVFGSFQGLQNTTFTVNNYDFDTQFQKNTVLTDEFKFRTNSWGLGFEAKLFREFAPIGRYVFIGGQINKTYTDVYPTYVTSVTDLITYEELIETDKREVGLLISKDLGVTFGFGRNRLLTRLLSLDYGVRSTLFMRDREPQTVVSDDYKSYFHDIVDRMALVNLQSSSYIEIYLRFGISF
ncbi:MAG: hypothetical protein ACI857_001969 [Arenicella sp.]|jgi:hypothetical protein